MHRFFLPDTPLAPGQTVDLAPIAHQARAVLRLVPGARILLLDGSGYAFPTEIRALGRSAAAGLVLGKEPVHSEPILHVTLYQAMLKADKFEWILQKGAEIGVSAFVPVISQRTVVRPADKVLRRYPRWRSILREAAEQSERGRIPDLGPPVVWDAAVSGAAGLRLLLDAGGRGATPGMSTVLARAFAAAPGPPAVSLLLGPEGGVSPTEAEQAQAAGWQAVSLGPRILRAETAALVAATLALDYAGDLGSPPVEDR